MTRYVAFLRGVNVAGITIPMAELRTMLVGLGYGNVKTILASGNALFDSDEDPATVKAGVEAALRRTFGYDAWIVLLDLPTVRSIVDAYPFDAVHESRHPYVMLSSDPDSLAELVTLGADLDPALERIAPGEGVLYWEVERGSTLRSPFGKACAGKRFKSTTTTRNLRTLRKVLA